MVVGLVGWFRRYVHFMYGTVAIISVVGLVFVELGPLSL